MITYLLLNDWILLAKIILACIIIGLVGFFAGRSNGYTTAWASAKLHRWVDGTFVKCNDGQYRSLSTVQENMGSNELCNAYNVKMKEQERIANGWRRIADAYAIITEGK